MKIGKLPWTQETEHKSRFNVNTGEKDFDVLNHWILDADGISIDLKTEHSSLTNATSAKDLHNLFFAAPDMYEALIKVISVADRKTVEFDMAKATLKKARGES